MKTILPLFIIIIVVLVGIKFYQSNQTPPVSDSDADLILFWGDGCPHCKNVDEYISKEKVDDKVKISRKEVYYNKVNQILLESIVKKCPEIDTKDGVGVPLAFDQKNQKCISGDQPIISWLTAKL